METDADGHAVQYECRLGEHRGHGLRIEKQLIVQCSVIGNPTVFIHDFLPAGSIGNYLESDFIAGHYADLDSLLAACQLPDYIAFNFLTYRYFREHFLQKSGIQFFIIVLMRRHEQSRHVGTAGAHRQMIRTVGKIVM